GRSATRPTPPTSPRSKLHPSVNSRPPTNASGPLTVLAPFAVILRSVGAVVPLPHATQPRTVPRPRGAGSLSPGGCLCVTSPPMRIERVGIVGSGIMGSGIAEVAAKAGLQVVLRSRKQATADAMLASLEKSLAKQVDRGRIEQSEADAVRGRVSATEQLADLADCDLVIESVVEDLEVKRGLFTELDGIVKPDAILATNTSTLPVVEMAMA